MPATTPDHNDPALTPSDGLIASLWERVRGLHTAVLQAKAAGDADALAAARLQFRVTTLLLSSCPATTMGDLMPKVLVAAMIRAGVEGEEVSYTLDMVERAITLDVNHLQGPPLTALASACADPGA